MFLVMTQEEKRNICFMMRRETGCDLTEASVAIDKLIEAFKIDHYLLWINQCI